MTYYVSSGTLNPTHSLTHTISAFISALKTPIFPTGLWCLTTLCLKKDTDAAHYNFDTDQPILIIFGRDDVAERVYYLMVICYPTSPN